MCQIVSGKYYDESLMSKIDGKTAPGKSQDKKLNTFWADREQNEQYETRFKHEEILRMSKYLSMGVCCENESACLRLIPAVPQESPICSHKRFVSCLIVFRFSWKPMGARLLAIMACRHRLRLSRHNLHD